MSHDTTQKKIRYLSLFSGIGGFELGIQQAYENNCRGFLQSKETENIQEHITNNTSRQDRTTCIGYSEIDKYAIQIYEKHFNHKNYGDITKINAEELPDFDLLVGGFPCQSFSIAGKRKGFDDTRGTLFFDIARILRAKQPKLFLLENVKGLLSHDNGKTFSTIISTLTELGYDLQWQVLNSKNHGVPQNRERIFIVGHLRGTRRPKVFPIGETDQEAGESDTRVASVRTSGDRGKQKTYLKYNEVQTLSANPMSDNIPRIVQLNQPKHSNDRVYGTDGVSPTLNTAQGGNRQPFIADDWKIRRLTPTECERLQGFPDGWTEGVSDTQRYKCLGNAVTVNVIRDIIIKLFNHP